MQENYFERSAQKIRKFCPKATCIKTGYLLLSRTWRLQKTLIKRCQRHNGPKALSTLTELNKEIKSWWLVVVGDESWWLVVGETIRQTNSGSRWGSPLWSLLSNTDYFLTDPRIFSTLRNKRLFSQPGLLFHQVLHPRECMPWIVGILWHWRSHQNYSNLPFVPFEGQSYQAMSDENIVKQWDWTLSWKISTLKNLTRWKGYGASVPQTKIIILAFWPKVDIFQNSIILM